MGRFTISLDESLAREFDRLIERRGYGSRSEAVRDLLRGLLEEQRREGGQEGHCVASLSYVYNHHERELAERLTHLQHAQHDLTAATMHVHLDHDHCLETVVLRGPVPAVRSFSQQIMAERGVRHGQVNLVSVELDERRHAHRHAAGRPHAHLKPRS